MEGNEVIDPRKLVALSEYEMNAVGPGRPDNVWVDRKNGVVVQAWSNATPGCNQTPWAGTLRVAVKHTEAKNPNQAMKRGFAKPITWDDLQAIKDHFWPDRIAVEVFPPKDKIVDVADMRWIWVLPKGAVLPFNLQGNSTNRLES